MFMLWMACSESVVLSLTSFHMFFSFFRECNIFYIKYIKIYIFIINQQISIMVLRANEMYWDFILSQVLLLGTRFTEIFKKVFSRNFPCEILMWVCFWKVDVLCVPRKSCFMSLQNWGADWIVVNPSNDIASYEAS